MPVGARLGLTGIACGRLPVPSGGGRRTAPSPGLTTDKAGTDRRRAGNCAFPAFRASPGRLKAFLPHPLPACHMCSATRRLLFPAPYCSPLCPIVGWWTCHPYPLPALLVMPITHLHAVIPDCTHLPIVWLTLTDVDSAPFGAAHRGGLPALGGAGGGGVAMVTPVLPCCRGSDMCLSLPTDWRQYLWDCPLLQAFPPLLRLPFPVPSAYAPTPDCLPCWRQ